MLTMLKQEKDRSVHSVASLPLVYPNTVLVATPYWPFVHEGRSACHHESTIELLRQAWRWWDATKEHDDHVKVIGLIYETTI
jgi:hypothetical protein